MFQRYETNTSGGRVPLGHMVTDDDTELDIRLWASNRSPDGPNRTIPNAPTKRGGLLPYDVQLNHTILYLKTL